MEKEDSRYYPAYATVLGLVNPMYTRILFGLELSENYTARRYSFWGSIPRQRWQIMWLVAKGERLVIPVEQVMRS